MELVNSVHLIIQDFFSAFGVFTILYYLASVFIKSDKLKQVDQCANAFISFIGIVFSVVWLSGLVLELSTIGEEERISLLGRMFGKYWFGFWTQPLLWILITQLLRVKRIRKNILLRLLFGFFLMLTIEKCLY
ncbi:MAG: hypothetical protein EOO46_15720 [Flavobacterium sp.]|nr:MAG: hypothetical protein EOO46_15720 [Flavobacterium sp.]